MSGTLLGQSEHIARKNHHDDGAQYFDWMIIRDIDKKRVVDQKEAEYLKLTEDEIKVIQQSIDSNWIIKIGEPYIKQAAIGEGGFGVYKTRKEINVICEKYSLYQED